MSEAISEAILLVGGRGTRLRPLTATTPKPLLPVAGVPFLSHQFARARAAGVRHIVLATSYRAEVFEESFGDGTALGLELEYVTEDVPLGTGGAIRNAARRLRSGPDDPVLVFNGDILSAVDLGGLVAAHADTGSSVTLHLTRVPDPRAFGLVPTRDDGRVTAFLEKPERPEQIVTDQINAGCYVFRRSVIDAIPAGRRISVEREVFPGLLADGARLHGVVDTSYWLDLGTPAAYVRGSCDLLLGVVHSPAMLGPYGESLLLPDAEVATDALVGGGTTVGARGRVEGGARIEGSVLHDDVVIGPGAVVRNSILGRGARVGAECVITGGVLGDHAEVGPRNELREGARVWCGVTLPECAVRFSSDE